MAGHPLGAVRPNRAGEGAVERGAGSCWLAVDGAPGGTITQGCTQGEMDAQSSWTEQ